VADAEVVRDLVQHDALHLTREHLRIVAVIALERAAVDRDPVRQERVPLAVRRARHALVEPEERLPVGRLVLDVDLDVVHVRPQIRRERVDRVQDELLERIVVYHGSQPSRYGVRLRIANRAYAMSASSVSTSEPAPWRSAASSTV